MVSSRPVLGRVIRRADTAAVFTNTASLYGNRRSVLRCVARGVAREESGGPWPQPSIEWIFLRKKLALLVLRACFIQYTKVVQTTARKRSSTFLRKNASAFSFCSHQCKILVCPCALPAIAVATQLCPLKMKMKNDNNVVNLPLTTTVSSI